MSEKMLMDLSIEEHQSAQKAPEKDYQFSTQDENENWKYFSNVDAVEENDFCFLRFEKATISLRDEINNQLKLRNLRLYSYEVSQGNPPAISKTKDGRQSIKYKVIPL